MTSPIVADSRLGYCPVLCDCTPPELAHAIRDEQLTANPPYNPVATVEPAGGFSWSLVIVLAAVALSLVLAGSSDK